MRLLVEQDLIDNASERTRRLHAALERSRALDDAHRERREERAREQTEIDDDEEQEIDEESRAWIECHGFVLFPRPAASGEDSPEERAA